MKSRLWYERVAREIRRLPSRTLLLCNPTSGIDYIAQRVHDLQGARVTVWIGDPSAGDSVNEILSESITSGLGLSLSDKATPVNQSLIALREYQRTVGPVSLILGWVHLCPDAALQLQTSVGERSSLLIVADSQNQVPVLEGFTTVSGDFLRMSFDEALVESRGLISDADVHSLLEKANGEYSTFKLSLIRRLGGDRVSIEPTSLWNWGEAVSVDALLDLFIQHERWADAFDLACARVSERLETFIDGAGNYYFNMGAYTYFWSRLDALPPDIKRQEKVAYWLVTAALATNNRKRLNSHAGPILRQSVAPDIRASAAVASPGDGMLTETSHAIRTLRSPATLRAHGFALSWTGQRDEPIRLFREAMQLAEREGADHLVVACGVDIAEAEIRKGNYRSGAEWTEWALAEYERRGLHDSLRRLSAIAINCFARLLLGEVSKADRLASNASMESAYIEVPGYEAITSTLGDLALLKGDYSKAIALYESIHNNVPIEVFCFTGVSLLGAQIAAGNWEAALKLAESAYVISRATSQYERGLGDLMMGMAKSRSDLVAAESHLCAALESLVGVSAELHISQASAWLAATQLARGRRKAALTSLQHGAKGLKELGPAGWHLICSRQPHTDEVAKLWGEADNEYYFNFLGARRIQIGEGQFDIGLRAAEVIAILSIHKAGLNGDRLHAYLYGDQPFSKSALKASVSRLRDLVPIGSTPYRIEVPFKADFTAVLELISVGELQRALNEYSGPLLPESESPLIGEWREHIDEAIRSAVIESNDPDHLIQLATTLDDDLELWELAKASISPGDYRRPVINARIRRIRASWGASEAGDVRLTRPLD